MRGGDNGRVLGPGKVAQQADDVLPGLAVQVAGKFIRQDQTGAVRQSAGNADALLFPAR